MRLSTRHYHGSHVSFCIQLQTVALLNLAGPDGAKAGLAVGTATSAGLIAFYLKRALDTGWYSLSALACSTCWSSVQW